MVYQDPSPASDAPWTAEEEKMLAASAPQVDSMDTGRLEALCEAYAPSNFAGRTRGDQLRHAAVTAGLERRREAVKRAREVLDATPVFRMGSVPAAKWSSPTRGWVMDDSSALRLKRMDLEQLRTEYERVMSAAEIVRIGGGASLPRDRRTQLFEYLNWLRKRLADVT